MAGSEELQAARTLARSREPYHALCLVVKDSLAYPFPSLDFLALLSLGRAKLHCLRIHDLFGNPFHSVTFSPSWRTDTALTLARQMYDSRDFGAMPILADALQDAGCDNEDVLNHCRDANATHVRGCWVVDGVLGKE
jgi:hypothetical protein